MQTQSRPRRAQPPGPLASGVHAAVRKKMKTPPPILASDVLREDLAPIEPGRNASRLWDGGAALLYLGVGICLRLDLGVSQLAPQASAICLAAAAASGATALVPFPYLWRAVVGAMVGATVVTLGLFGAGPLALLTAPDSSAWIEALRVLTCTALPAALLFRSLLPSLPSRSGSARRRVPRRIAVSHSRRHGHDGRRRDRPHRRSARSDRRALWTFRVHGGADHRDDRLVRAGSDRARGSRDRARQLYAPHLSGAGPIAYTLTAVAFFTAVVPMALGLFQTLAAVYAPEARMIDVHGLPCPTKKRRSYPTSFPVILRRCRNAQSGPKGRNSAPRTLSSLTTNDDALRVDPGPRWPGRTRGKVVEHRPYCAYSRPRERSVPS